MDYVTRQFINLAKKLRKDLRSALSSLHHDRQEQIEAIRETRKAYDKSRDTPPILRAELQVPHPIEVQTDPKDKKTGRERYKLVIETLTLLGVVAYAIVAIRQWREMISARHQAQVAVQAAQTSAATAQQALDFQKEGTRREQRPYIFLGASASPGIKEFILFHPYPTFNPNSPEPFRANIGFKNFGHSPAVRVRFGCRVAFGKNAAQQVRFVPFDTAVGEFAMAPDENAFHTCESTDQPRDAQAVIEVLGTNYYLNVFGQFEYFDMWDKSPTYYTDFCYTRLANGAVGECPNRGASYR